MVERCLDITLSYYQVHMYMYMYIHVQVHMYMYMYIVMYMYLEMMDTYSVATVWQLHVHLQLTGTVEGGLGVFAVDPLPLPIS